MIGPAGGNAKEKQRSLTDGADSNHWRAAQRQEGVQIPRERVDKREGQRSRRRDAMSQGEGSGNLQRKGKKVSTLLSSVSVPLLRLSALNPSLSPRNNR